MTTLYTKPGCMPCQAAKRKMDELAIPYQIKDAIDCVDEVKELGFLAAPVTVAPDGTCWQGYRPDLLEALAA